MGFKTGYLLTGFVLAGALAGAVSLGRLAKPKLPIVASDFPRSQGPVEAPVQLIEYSVFQCPACRTAQSDVKALLKDFEGRVRFTYQHFPLEGHPFARSAHQAAECAAEQNRFWNYHDLLYERQPDWSRGVPPPPESFMRYAQELGLDLDRFAKCLTDPQVAARIREERIAGEGLGVRSTPSFFLNGELVVGPKELRKKMEEVLGE